MKAIGLIFTSNWTDKVPPDGIQEYDAESKPLHNPWPTIQRNSAKICNSRKYFF